MPQSHKPTKTTKPKLTSKVEPAILPEVTLLVLGAVIVALVVGVAMGLMMLRHFHRFGEPTTEHPITVSSSVTTAPGEARNNIFSVNVKRVWTDDASVPGLELAKGNESVGVQLEVRNYTLHSRPFYPSIQTYIRDADGNTFMMHPMMLKDPLQAGPVAPGGSLGGELSYEMLKGAHQPKLYIDPGWFGALPLVFDLNL